jgi:hypothetical protein
MEIANATGLPAWTEEEGISVKGPLGVISGASGPAVGWTNRS